VYIMVSMLVTTQGLLLFVAAKASAATVAVCGIFTTKLGRV